MTRIIFGITACVWAAGAIVYLGTWRSSAPENWRIETQEAAIRIAPTAEAAGAAPSSVQPPADRTIDPPVRRSAAPPKFGRSVRPASSRNLGDLVKRGKPGASADEILSKFEEAIRSRNNRTARDLARQLVRAMRDGDLDADEAIGRLIAILKGDVDPMALRVVVPQLGSISDPQLSQFFQDRYWSTQDLGLRNMYLTAVRQGADENAIPFLQQILETEGQQSLRNQALYALSRVDSDSALRILEDTARSGSGVDQITALNFLSSRQDGNYASLFEEALTRPGGANIHETAIRGLMRSGTSSSIPILESIRDDPEASDYLKSIAKGAIRSIEQREKRSDRRVPPPGEQD